MLLGYIYRRLNDFIRAICPHKIACIFANKWYFRQIQVQVDNKIINLQNVINSFEKKC